MRCKPRERNSQAAKLKQSDIKKDGGGMGESGVINESIIAAQIFVVYMFGT